MVRCFRRVVFLLRLSHLARPSCPIVLYGERGLHGIEVKRTARFREDDIAALRLICADYPQARGLLLYGGHQRYRFGKIDVVPLGAGLKELGERLG